MFDKLRADFRAVFDMDPAATSRLEVILTYSGFHAILSYRVAHWFHRMGMPFFARVLSQFARFMTGIEIHPGAKIAGSFFIDHGMGVVVGETSEIGENVTLFQGVTLGGTGKERGKRHPTIGNHVVVGAGAKVLGGITIGDHVKIGANAVVLKSVPPHSTVVGVPGRVVRVRGKRADESMLDHVHMPDPMSEMLAELQRRVEKLEQRQPGGAAQTRQRPPRKSSAPRKETFELPEETVEERQARMAKMEKQEMKRTLYGGRPKAEQKDAAATPPAGKVRKRRRRPAKKKEASQGQGGSPPGATSGGSGRNEGPEG